MTETGLESGHFPSTEDLNAMTPAQRGFLSLFYELDTSNMQVLLPTDVVVPEISSDLDPGDDSTGKPHLRLVE